jgi:hypothetical protein
MPFLNDHKGDGDVLGVLVLVRKSAHSLASEIDLEFQLFDMHFLDVAVFSLIWQWFAVQLQTV